MPEPKYFFDENPKRKRRRKGGRSLRGRKRDAKGRLLPKGHKKRRRSGKRRSTRRRSSGRKRTTRRRHTKRRRSIRAKAVTITLRRNKRRRHYRRNPMGGGLVRHAMTGLKRGAQVEAGRIAMGFAETLVPPTMQTGITGTAVAAVLATVVGMAASKALGAAGGEFIAAGAWSRAIDRLVVTVAPTIAKKVGLAGYVPLTGYVGLNGLGENIIDAEPGNVNYPAGITDADEGLGWSSVMG